MSVSVTLTPPAARLSWAAGPLVPRLLVRIERGLVGVAPGSEPASRAVRDLLAAGGKRLRPLLVYLGGRMTGADPAQLDELAAAAELVHVASLLHDDLMDGAGSRRGQPAAWRVLGPKAAVLGGDLAHVLALQRVSRAPPPVMPRFLETVACMVRAQSLETERVGSLEGGVAAWRSVAYGKTAALVGWCAEAGGLVAGQGAATDSARRFGESLGLAFQATDDLLDLVPGMDPGKTPYADLRARVPSLPILLAAQLEPSLRARLLERWRLGPPPDDALARAVFRAGGPATHAYLQRQLDVARRALGFFPASEERSVLLGMLDTLEGRAAACMTSASTHPESP